jgi:hypothetical protein
LKNSVPVKFITSPHYLWSNTFKTKHQRAEGKLQTSTLHLSTEKEFPHPIRNKDSTHDKSDSTSILRENVFDVFTNKPGVHHSPFRPELLHNLSRSLQPVPQVLMSVQFSFKP